MKRKIIFLLYDSRSGSTFFSALINRYKGISVSHEGPYVPKILEYAKPLQTDQDLTELVDYLYASQLMKELGLEKKVIATSLLELKKPYTKKKIIKSITNTYFNFRDPKARVGVLKQSIYDYTHVAVNTFSDISFVHIVRDGRAVLNSKIRSSKAGPGTFVTNIIKSAKGWQSKVEKMEAFKKIYSDLLYTVKYEDLVKEPDKTLDKLLLFLELNNEEKEKTKSQSAYSKQIGKSQQDIHKSVSKPPKPSKINKWKQNLVPNQILLYEALAGKSLKKMGYPRLYGDSYRLSTKLCIFYLALKSYSDLLVVKSRIMLFYIKKENSLKDFIKRRIKRFNIRLQEKLWMQEKDSYTKGKKVK